MPRIYNWCVEKKFLYSILSGMRIRPAFMYKVLGFCFLFLGLYTAFNVLEAWRLGEIFLIEASAYALLNFAVAYGFLNRQRWLVPAFLAAALGDALLIALQLAVWEGIPILRPLLGMGLAVALLGYLYYTRASLRSYSPEWLGGVLFFVVWTPLFLYSVYILLPL